MSAVRWRVLLAALGTLLMLYLGVWSYRFAVAQLGPFAPLVAVLVLVLVAMLLGPWLLIRYRAPLQGAVGHATRWLWIRLDATGIPTRTSARMPRLWRFVAARLVLGSATGLGLTIGLVIAGAVAWVFGELLAEVATGSSIVAVDRRIINLVATLRTPTLDRWMLLITFLGNARTIGLLATGIVTLALVLRRYRVVVMIVLAPVASSLFFSVIKVLVGRPRPLLENARIVQGGFSFPSGHSAVAATFYGTLAYLLLQIVWRWPLRGLVVLVGVMIPLLIGVSRVYLGVHYPSDVLAGWTAGAFWVVIVGIVEHLRPLRSPPELVPWRRVVAAVVLVGLIFLVSTSILDVEHQALPPPPALTEPLVLIAPVDVPTIVVSRAPHHTETLLGRPQAPINLIFVGTQAQLEHAFSAAGWLAATRQGFPALERATWAALRGQPDPSGPVTPSFLAERPNILAFSQPVGATFAQRHHIRIWSTEFQTSKQRLWLAAASYDRGFELARATYLPTHQIDPAIDNERDYIVAQLQRAGAVLRVESLQLVPPELGYNAAGDPYFTYGKAIILWLRPDDRSP